MAAKHSPVTAGSTVVVPMDSLNGNPRSRWLLVILTPVWDSANCPMLLNALPAALSVAAQLNAKSVAIGRLLATTIPAFHASVVTRARDFLLMPRGSSRVEEIRLCDPGNVYAPILPSIRPPGIFDNQLSQIAPGGLETLRCSAAGMALLSHDRTRILLAGEYRDWNFPIRPLAYKMQWNFLGGRVDNTDSGPAFTAAREFFEETGGLVPHALVAQLAASAHPLLVNSSKYVVFVAVVPASHAALFEALPGNFSALLANPPIPEGVEASALRWHSLATIQTVARGDPTLALQSPVHGYPLCQLVYKVAGHPAFQQVVASLQ
jgi:8-oxo-dGTP pyrophosphatase MutT (NUDIX family)